MKKDGLIVRTTEDDRAMAKRVNAQASHIAKMMNLTNYDMRMLLAGDKLVSNDDIFNILKKQGRLYSDKCLLKAGFVVSKPRSAEQIQELFTIGERESVYQEFVFHCERRTYFLKLCSKIIEHVEKILRVYDSDGKKRGLLSLAEWELLESIANMQDLCDEGLNNVKNLMEEYHTYYMSRNDILYNTKSGVDMGFSFRDSFVYYFSWLNQTHLTQYRPNCHSIDDSIEDFFHTLVDNKADHRCLVRILKGESIPYNTKIKVSPLNQFERDFINAFAFLD
ncbi:MAG: hypothetical protein WC004_01845 [Candidatus Absconditabacterales bacterium]